MLTVNRKGFLIRTMANLLRGGVDSVPQGVYTIHVLCGGTRRACFYSNFGDSVVYISAAASVNVKP